IFALMVLVTFLFQNISGFFPRPFSLSAMLLIPLTVCLGMFEGEFAGAFYGLFAGALWDIVASRGAGVHALVLMLAGCICGLLIHYTMRNNLACAFVLTSIVCFVHNFFYWLFCVAFVNMDGAFYALWRYYLLSGIYTILLTPLFYFIIRAIMKSFRDLAKQ
ncbi:MAG: rod shape-determining protein MreD, partial [Clostridiales bacterium]|nr:rod shape-determining protein MreD [Clostridiales bacterium]